MKKYLGLDFETANTNLAACSVGLYLIDASTLEPLKEYYTLIDPEADFDDRLIEIHGITKEDIQGKPNFSEAVQVIHDLIDDETVVVCHNAGFDMTVYRKSCIRYGIPAKKMNYVCTLIYSQYLFPKHLSYKLENLVIDFELPIYKSHNALEDAKACINLLSYMLQNNGCLSIEELSKKANCTIGMVMTAKDYSSCHHNYNKKNDLSDVAIIPNYNHPFYGKNILFSGKLAYYTKDEAMRMVKEIGANPMKGFNRTINILVLGKPPKGINKTDKEQKAEKYLAEGADIQIIGEDEFFEIMNQDY